MRGDIAIISGLVVQQSDSNVGKSWNDGCASDNHDAVVVNFEHMQGGRNGLFDSPRRVNRWHDSFYSLRKGSLQGERIQLDDTTTSKSMNI